MTENKTRKKTNEEWNSLYMTTFDGIKAPYELYRKVADMKNIEKSKTNIIKKGVIAAAVALSLYFAATLPYTQQPAPAGSDALWYPGPVKKKKWFSTKKPLRTGISITSEPSKTKKKTPSQSQPKTRLCWRA